MVLDLEIYEIWDCWPLGKVVERAGSEVEKRDRRTFRRQQQHLALKEKVGSLLAQSGGEESESED
jgi:hypothetical protein